MSLVSLAGMKANKKKFKIKIKGKNVFTSFYN